MDIVGTTSSSSVTLIIKAPNQSVSDQVIKCEMAWSIQNLKDHLTTVYPSKPTISQQKIIYSGKLLQNHMVLKDCLKSYSDDQKTHTIHLVCNQPELTEKPKPAATPQQTTQAARDRAAGHSMGTLMSTMQAPTSIMPSPQEIEGLRRRILDSGTTNYWTAASPGTVPHPSGVVPAPTEMIYQQQNPYYHYYQPGVAAPQTQHQYAEAHRQYVRQMDEYLRNYRENYIAEGHAGLATHQAATVTPLTVEQPAVVEQAAAAVAPPVQAAVNNNDDDEEEEERDWLHYVYSGTRILLLISFIYFYSTIGRFMGICFIIGFIYLYQNGMFGIFRRLPRPNDVQQQNAAANGAGPQVAPPNAAAAANNSDTPTVATPPAPVAPSTLLMITNFCVSFFTSLIPQNPEVI